MTGDSLDKHPASTAELIRSLNRLRANNPKAVRPTVHLYPATLYSDNGESSATGNARDRFITSWKMTEHMYFRADNHFPTLARGLFIEDLEAGEELPPGVEDTTTASSVDQAGRCEEDSESDGSASGSSKTVNGQPRRSRIVARGYDKFFNVDEVEWTNWDHMKIHTEPPYRLTLKSNGCLILIAALSPSHLVVASKHSLGTVTENTVQDEALAGAMQQINFKKTDDHALRDTAKSAKDDGKKSGKRKGKDVARRHDVDGEEYAGVDAGANKQDSSHTEDNTNGDEEDHQARQHAEVGREWLKKMLRTRGKTEADLARRLWDANSTAVLELCDDSFEEHVIATPVHWTGLHLHGLNHNTPHFSTAPPSEVTALAMEFGFIPTKYVELQTLDEVKEFTDEIAKEGSWEGDMIEGFVIRSIVKDLEGKHAIGRPPYRPGAPFFFKVKFEEPYLLYRQWREMTRVMLPLLQNPNAQQEAEVWKRVRSKTKRPEVDVYAEWCEAEMRNNPKLFEGYDRGVVRVRAEFLRWTENDGKEVWQGAKDGERKPGKMGQKDGKPGGRLDGKSLPRKWVLVPVAVPGCGKTTMGVALSKLFGFAHTQSDDVIAKKTAPTFLKNIADCLRTKDVVYADRNNHIVKHYTELSALQTNKYGKHKLEDSYNVRFIGIVWDIDNIPYHRALRLCSERVVKRGDNHQTLRPDLTMEAEHEAIVSNFLRNFTPPDPSIFDEIIDVHIDDDPRTSLGRIVDGLVNTLHLTRPSEEAIDDALNAATAYKVTTPYHAPERVGKNVRYFGFAPEIDIVTTVRLALTTSLSSSTAQDIRDFLDVLQPAASTDPSLNTGKLFSKPHVTLAHSKQVQEEKTANGEVAETKTGPAETFWNDCKAIAELALAPLYEADITHLVWNDRIMALALSDLRLQTPAMGKQMVPELELPVDVRSGLHITVGMRVEGAAGFESRALTQAARKGIARGLDDEGVLEGEGEGEGEGGIVRRVRMEGVKVQGRIRGMY